MNWQFWKIKKKPEIKFPCKECLVLPTCSKACEKIVKNTAELTKFMFEVGCCPDCGEVKFYEGPSGGASTNIQCSFCNHWFNVAEPLFAERIRMLEDGTFR